jgi:small subunit ribosomal protein S13
MARIVGIDIPDQKRVEIALTYIYGIGKPLSLKILKQVKISPDERVKNLSEEQIEKIRQYIGKNFKVEGDLKVEISQNIKRLKEISAYRGLRHAKNLPVHGQRTKTNARTKRGKKVTIGSGRKKTAEKT